MSHSESPEPSTDELIEPASPEALEDVSTERMVGAFAISAATGTLGGAIGMAIVQEGGRVITGRPLLDYTMAVGGAIGVGIAHGWQRVRYLRSRQEEIS